MWATRSVVQGLRASAACPQPVISIGLRRNVRGVWYSALFKMKKPAPRQQQLALMEKHRHGGARPGAGRKPSGRRVGVPHRRRERHLARHPVHVTLREREGLPSLRGDRLLLEAMRTSIAASEKPSFRVVHFSIQSNHLHLIVEADDEKTLSRGMQALSIRMVHAIHRALGHGGTVFADRYHAHQLQTPRETRAALLYVLQNWAKHGSGGDYDPRSSALWFDGWTRPPPAPVEEPLVAASRTWLVRIGWRRHGLLRPGERPAARLLPAVPV